MNTRDTGRPNLLPHPRSVAWLGGPVQAGPVSTRYVRDLPPQGYRLRVCDQGIWIEAADPAGERYARLTLAQLADPDRRELVHPVVIEDWPDLLVRGVMLDISRDRVPALPYLKGLLDRLASWKINHVQLYMEHTFAYGAHAAVHRDASPLTAAEIRELDLYCQSRGIELAANQNSLGHMERWLKHPQYSHLAFEPEGSVNSLGLRRPPMTADPRHPETHALVAGLLEELLPHFASRRVHLGLDETWELPPDQPDLLLAWLARLLELPALRDRDVLVWSDMFRGHAQPLAHLERRVTLCEWGYEADHPFTAGLAALEAQGLVAWACPGTSSWLSLLGRVDVAEANCRAAMAAAADSTARALLMTDWGDNGHHQPAAISDPGFVWAAALSWCQQSHASIDMAAALDRHCYGAGSHGLGETVLALGRIASLVKPGLQNMSALAAPFYYPEFTVGTGLTNGVGREQIDQARAILVQAQQKLRSACPQEANGLQAKEELSWAVDLGLWLTDNFRYRLEQDGTLRHTPHAVRRALALRLTRLAENYAQMWLQRSRPGGLKDSLKWFARLLIHLDGGPTLTDSPTRLRV